jgi:PilZ domain
VQSSIDRRAFRRFQVLVPVLFHWADSADHDEHYDAGDSGNIGLGGMFIFAAKCPPIGTEVEIEFTIPAFEHVPRRLRFACRGRVIRVEACYQVAGFAVAGRIQEGEALRGDVTEFGGSLTRSSVLH